MNAPTAPTALELLLAEIEQRAAAEQHLADYAQRVVGVTPALHHRYICDELERGILNDEWDDCVVCLPPGGAKALALDTPIPTPDGWTTMGALRVGDTVFDENGRPCDVTWVSPVWRNRPVYSVTTDCGDEIIADHDHEWLVRLCGKHPVFKIKETHQLHRKRSKRPMIARATALDLPDVFLPIHPYLLGVWLGDGTSASMAITSSDEDRPWMRSELERLGYETSDRSATMLFGVKGVRALFTHFGLLHDPAHNTYGRKHIPQQYLRGSYLQRLHLLQGLVDTDGTVCKTKGSTTFCNTNLELAVQVRELVRSLGVKAGWSESRAVLNGVDHGPVYRVSFYLKDSARLPRKARLTRDSTRTTDTYIDVVPAGRADTVCIEVDSPSHLFLCGRSMTPTHNSTYASHCLPSWFLGHFPDNNVILASHTATLAEKWSRRVRDTVASPEHTRVFENSTLSKDSTSVSKWSTSRNGEFLAAGVGMSILGFRADIAVLDDPVSGWEQAQSATQLEKIHNWFKADLKSRLKPNAKIIVICQRTAAYDMAGYVMKEHAENPTRRLKTIVLPMLAGEDDPLGRAPGERLWPDWYTPEMVADLQKDEFIWKTMWQQEPPSDDGSWITSDEIRIVDIVPDALSTYLVSDLALSVNKGDYSVHATVGVATNGSVYVTDMWRERTSVDVTVAKHLELVDTYAPLESLIDDDNASKVYVQLLANQARERGIPVPWKTMPMRGQDKETRAAPLRGMFKRGMIFFKRAPWNRWIVNELLMFPNAIGSGVDDGVDALSLIGRRLSSLARPAGEVPPPKPLPTTQEMTLHHLFEDNELKRGSRRRI